MWRRWGLFIQTAVFTLGAIVRLVAHPTWFVGGILGALFVINFVAYPRRSDD